MVKRLFYIKHRRREYTKMHVYFVCQSGEEQGGREGASAPPHLPKIFFAPCNLFLNILVANPQPLIKGQIIFQKN
jgi:hypothetical protein